ncbi:MAG: DUF6272 family protein [Cyclobacteriaceae bacterium]|nr:DUF6272 family protein [Cyclobacteriaceae bacterium]
MSPSNKSLEIEEIASELMVHKAVYQYIGNIDLDTTDKVILEVDDLLSHQNYPNKIRKKAFHITIEVVQNLYKYLLENHADPSHSKGIFLIHSSNDNEIIITSGNYLLRSEVNSLKSRIKLINSFTSDELAHFYRGLLDVGTISKHGGAGLGFVDIAKKSGNKIQYEFKEVDNDYAFYIFKIIISN